MQCKNILMIQQRYDQYQAMAVLIGNHYEKHGQISIVRFRSIVSVLCNAYIEFVREGVPAIEQLPLEQRNRYWEESKKHYLDEKSCIQTSKAIYVIHLITSGF